MSPSSCRIRDTVVDALADGIDSVADAVDVAAYVVAIAGDVGLHSAIDPVLCAGLLLGLGSGWFLRWGRFEGLRARGGFRGGGAGSRGWFDCWWRLVGGIFVSWAFDWWRFLVVEWCCWLRLRVGHLGGVK